VAVVPAGHALARLAAHPEKLTLKELGRYPIVTYEAHFSGRSRIDAAFAAAQIEPSIVLEAIDADVIKTYARAGLGVGLVAGVALEQNAEGLAVIGCGHLFGRNTTRLAVKQGAYLRGFVYSFIEMVAPGWDRSRLEQEFSGRSSASRADK
jgi:LysR family cys regulon transcriptional activator